MSLVNQVDIGKKAPELVRAVIEIPCNSSVKYEMDAEKGFLVLDRILHAAMHYPGNYGFIPQTLDSDGDPLDVIIFCPVSILPGTVVEVRPVGVMLMEDEAGDDPKIIAVVSKDPMNEHVKELKDIPENWLKQVEHFFQQYKVLEKNKWAKIKGFKNKKDAHKVISDCIKAFRDKN